MKLAPNVKQQSRGIKHKGTEVIIFAGSDAWHTRNNGRNMMRVWPEIMSLLCGLGSSSYQNWISCKLCRRQKIRAHIQGRISCASNDKGDWSEAGGGRRTGCKFYPDGMHGQKVENWREYLARERQNLSDGLVIELPVKQRRNFRRWRTVSARSCLPIALMAFAYILKVKSFTYGAAGMVSGQHNGT